MDHPELLSEGFIFNPNSSTLLTPEPTRFTDTNTLLPLSVRVIVPYDTVGVHPAELNTQLRSNVSAWAGATCMNFSFKNAATSERSPLICLFIFRLPFVGKDVKVSV